MARPAALIWAALDDLDDIAAFIALDSETAAAALVQRELAAVERLRRFPASGRWAREDLSRSDRAALSHHLP